MTRRAVSLLTSALLVGVATAAPASTRILFLSKSSGFEHPVIQEDEDGQSHVGRVLASLASRVGAELVATKNAGLVRRAELDGFDLVIFFTTGDLTRSGGGEGGLFGGDGHPAMPPDGVQDLLSWIEEGGAFLGFHSASDTFHGAKGEVTPYLEMLGGEFRGHGIQFEGTVRVVDPEHPTMAAVPPVWRVKDEWYLFQNMNRDAIHVLALLDPGPERDQQEMYDVPRYPIVWCRELGQGRVYYNAMGHRADVWDNPVFQEMVVDALEWGLGSAPSAPRR